jgi:hypothetical protein
MIVFLALLYLLALTVSADAVPLVAAAISATFTATAATIGATTVTYATVLATAIVTAASVGLSLIMAPKADGGSKGQVTVRQSRPPRVRGYGRDKIAGAQAFLEADRRYLHRILVHCEGPVDEVEAIWLNDRQISTTGTTVKENTSKPWVGDVVIETKLGTSTQAASTILRGTYDDFSDYSDRWTADHQLKGLCYSVIRAKATKDAELFGRRFPNGMPDLRIVAKLSAVYDPREGGHDVDDETTWEWSDNSALCILDYLTNERGYAISPARIDMDSFSDFADVCDAAITLKGGGTEPRYRLGGMYELTEEPREVLRRMLQTCDAELYMTPDGKVAIRGGIWEEPTVTITEDQVIACSYEQGNDALAAFNRITLSYKSPAHGYEVIETQEWDDLEAQELSGQVKTQDLSLVMVPAHGQARRLAKIMMAKGNPRHKVTIQTNMAGLDALGQRIIRLVLPELDLDETFHVQRFEILGDLMSCSMDLVSLDSDAYAWNAATEEGDPPPVPQTFSNPIDYDTPPTPTGLALSLLRTEIAPGVFTLRIQAEVDEPATPGWGTTFEYRLDGTADDWVTLEAGATPWEGASDVLADGETYEVQAAHVGSGGLPGSYTTALTIEAVSDVVAPGSVTDLVVTPSVSSATVEWINPNSANYHETRIYRGATSTFAAATLIATRYGSANLPDVYVDDPLAGGPWYWWVVAANASGVEATEVGADDIVELWLEFTGGTLDGAITFTRAGPGTRVNSSGVLVSETTDVARFDYDPLTLAPLGILIEPSRTNLVRNNTMVSAVAGTPGTFPTNWAVITVGGMTRQIVAVGVINGISYIDYKISGTASGSAHSISFETSSGIAATNTQEFTVSAFLAVVGGSLSNISAVSFTGNMFNSTPTYLAEATNVTSAESVSATLTRVSRRLACNNASVAYLRPLLTVSFTNGTAIDVTIRVGMPQVELASSFSSVISTSTVAVTREADVCKFTPASPVDEIRYTFDNNSTSDASVTAGVEYTVPTNLSRARIKNIRSLIP